MEQEKILVKNMETKIIADKKQLRKDILAKRGKLLEQETKTPSLDEFGIDLTLAAQELRLDPVVGREKEIERLIQIISRRTKKI